jgi:hypothetical protein
MLMNRPNTVITKNHIIFQYNNNLYIDNLYGDNILNVFNVNLMNIYLEKYEDNIGKVVFDDITHISVIENRTERINILPSGLKSLSVMNSMCTRLILSDEVKHTIEYIFMNQTNLTEMPNIQNCNKLTIFKINFANIQAFNISYCLPESLREFNMANNLISNEQQAPKYIFTYDPLINKLTQPEYSKINFGNNHLNFDLFPEVIQGKCNVIRQKCYKFHPVNLRNVGDENALNFIGRVYNEVGTSTPTNILNSTQTVHLSSINKAVKASFETIQNYITNNNIVIHTTFKQLNSDKLYKQFLKRCSPDIFKFINIKVNLKNTYSLTHKTYMETFYMVWGVISYLSCKKTFETNDLFDNLIMQLTDSIDVCFTGIYNRLINSLVGILDGVYVGISSSEEVQLRFGQIIKELSTSTKSPNDAFLFAMNEAYCVLNEADSISIETWINALLDLAPDLESFVHNNITFMKNWENLIIDIKGNIIGEYIESINNIPEHIRLFKTR